MYIPPEMPDLSGETELSYDTETSGLRHWAGDVPCGYAIGTTDGRRWYLPTRHTGGNLPEDKVLAYLASPRGLAGKRLVTAKGSFDAHMSRAVGLDLERIGCSITDVLQYAALLDDSRRELNLNSVSLSYLGIGKIKGPDLSRGAHIYHAAELEEYAEGDADRTMRLAQTMRPLLTEQGLDDVRQLEDDCIFPTVEMERNGALIDVDKLELWLKESERDRVSALMELYVLVGFRVDPGNRKSLHQLFKALYLTVPRVQYGDKAYKPGVPDEEQSETFADDYLKKIKHPAIHLLRRALKLGSIRSKSLVPFMENVQANGIRYEGGCRVGIIRYALNQLRSDDGGTISGRYSSSAFSTSPRYGINIQQVAGKKQLAALKGLGLLKYNVRELFIPAYGKRWLRSDAKQIEYRLFAHYAKPPGIIAAYSANPDVDYHNIVMEMIRAVLESITRERTKDLNFAMLFGAGVKKIAFMMGVTEREARRFVQAYLDAFPEAATMRALAMKMMQERGFVRTLLGRRARYTGRDMLNSALNRIIQGSAADINKRKIAEVYAERKRLDITMRFTVHDELDCDVEDDTGANNVREVLNEQSFPTNVPILWDVGIGANWAASDNKPIVSSINKSGGAGRGLWGCINET